MLFCQELSLSLMVKLLLGSQGMLPIPVQKSLLLCQEKIVRRQGTILSIFYLHIFTKQGIQRKKLMSLLVSYFAFQRNRKFASSPISQIQRSVHSVLMVVRLIHLFGQTTRYCNLIARYWSLCRY